MITKEDLLNNGYREYSGTYPLHPSSNTLLQKCIKDKYGIKYYLNVYEYNFENIPNYPKPNKISYQFETKFNLYDEESCTIVYCYNDNKTIKEIEDWFANSFLDLACKYYEVY